MQRADFVGLTITEAVERVKRMRPWCIAFHTFNGMSIPVDQRNQTKLKAGDTLELIDP
jgi:oligoribonuclease (3'-5' exoribonuclease)